MPVEMIGWIAPRVSSELIPPSGPPFDAGVIAETARIHERAGFDRVLIGYFSDAPDGFLVGAHAASATERLGFLLAHRPGFVAPPVAARKLATLDQLSGGRLAVHIIAGGSDADQPNLPHPCRNQPRPLPQRRDLVHGVRRADLACRSRALVNEAPTVAITVTHPRQHAPVRDPDRLARIPRPRGRDADWNRCGRVAPGRRCCACSWSRGRGGDDPRIVLKALWKDP